MACKGIFISSCKTVYCHTATFLTCKLFVGAKLGHGHAHGFGSCGVGGYAEAYQAVGKWGEHMAELGSKHPGHGVRHASTGRVEGRMTAVHSYAVAYRGHHGFFDGRVAAEAFKAFEYKRVVRYYERASTRMGLFDNSRSYIDTKQYACTFGAPRAYLEAGVVPALLVGGVRQCFDGFYNVAVEHYFSSGFTISKVSSSSCFWSRAAGASSITSRPELFFGKAMQSRILSRPANRLTQRSRP